MRIGWTVLVGLMAACKSESEPEPEPLDLPADPSVPGAKVGVRTAEINGITVEVWYPTTEAVTGDPEELDLFTFAPQEFIDRVGDTLSVPTPCFLLISVVVRPAACTRRRAPSRVAPLRWRPAGAPIRRPDRPRTPIRARTVRVGGSA